MDARAPDDAGSGASPRAAHAGDGEARGRLKPGADADLTIFDPATVIDRSTYEDATIPSAGIPYVIVGGEIVVDRGQVTDAQAGPVDSMPRSPPDSADVSGTTPVVSPARLARRRGDGRSRALAWAARLRGRP